MIYKYFVMNLIIYFSSFIIVMVLKMIMILGSRLLSHMMSFHYSIEMNLLILPNLS